MNISSEQLRRLLIPTGPVRITVDDTVLKTVSEALHNVQVTLDVSPATMNLCYCALFAIIVSALVRLLRK